MGEKKRPSERICSCSYLHAKIYLAPLENLFVFAKLLFPLVFFVWLSERKPLARAGLLHFVLESKLNYQEGKGFRFRFRERKQACQSDTNSEERVRQILPKSDLLHLLRARDKPCKNQARAEVEKRKGKNCRKSCFFIQYLLSRSGNGRGGKENGRNRK